MNEIKSAKIPFYPDIKRFHVPVVIKSNCPNCDVQSERDLKEKYLSYPPVGEPFGVGMYCEHCDRNWEIAIILNITIELAEEEE